MITKATKYGKGYETPIGLTEEKYYEMIYEFIDLAKLKGLTVRQAQKLFTDCADAILDTKSNEKQSDYRYLESIAESLYKIAYRGIDAYNSYMTTNNN